MIVKITDGKDIRRFTTSTNNITYSAIHKHTAEAFGLGPKDFKLKYKDDEGDQITMSTDAEIQEAVSITLKLDPPVLRLTLVNNSRPASPARGAPAADPPDLAALFKNIKEQLPALVEQLPAAVKSMIPNAELDIAATVAATQEAMAAAAAGYGGANPAANPDMEGYHPNITCDKSNQSPIVGARYHMRGHDYDLNETEYNKLPEAEKAQFDKIEPTVFRYKAKTNAPAHHPSPKGFHPGVSCDITGQTPIFGWRFHKRGENYDLCEAEFNKLSDADKANYEKIAPPMGCWGGRGGGKWGGCGGKWGGAPHKWGGGWAAAAAAQQGGPPPQHNACAPPHCGKLAARFVSDVTIFDGTQMAPGTKFSKIWKLKNTGEVPWPPGTQIIFVGGDQMGTALTVPLSHQGPVMPGEEVDCSVDLVAPHEHGRYIGYWRLTGPMGRKKWGQRFWTHIHVVDPQAEPQPPTEKEMEALQQAASDRENDEEGGDDETMIGDGDGGAAEGGAAEDGADGETVCSDGEMVIVAAPDAVAAAAETVTTMMKAASVADAPAAAAGAPGSSDAPMPLAVPAAAPAAESPSVTVAATLGAMGFDNEELVQYVIEKNGPDVDACARDLAGLNENATGLTDLLEMGFADSSLNAKLMIKNGFSVKNTVRDLVSDAP